VADSSIIDYIQTVDRMILDRQNKFLWFANPKVATQSIGRHLLKDRVILKKDRPASWKILVKRMTYEDFMSRFKFVMVRNPYDRVVSAFHYLQQISWRRHRKKMLGEVDFRTFVKTQLKDFGPDVNEHFVVQYPTFLFNECFFVDYVVRFEDIELAWSYVAEKVECSAVLPHFNRSAHNHYRDYYDQECKDIVRRIYEKDLEFLEYEF